MILQLDFETLRLAGVCMADVRCNVLQSCIRHNASDASNATIQNLPPDHVSNVYHEWHSVETMRFSINDEFPFMGRGVVKINVISFLFSETFDVVPY